MAFKLAWNVSWMCDLGLCHDLFGNFWICWRRLFRFFPRRTSSNLWYGWGWGMTNTGNFSIYHHFCASLRRHWHCNRDFLGKEGTPRCFFFSPLSIFSVNSKRLLIISRQTRAASKRSSSSWGTKIRRPSKAADPEIARLELYICEQSRLDRDYKEQLGALAFLKILGLFL